MVSKVGWVQPLGCARCPIGVLEEIIRLHYMLKIFLLIEVQV